MMMHTHLQHMVEDIPDSSLPQAWVDHDLAFFSSAKRLYDYQQQALRNALKALWKYYEHFGDYPAGQKLTTLIPSASSGCGSGISTTVFQKTLRYN
jgi:hypothetical protein